MIEATMLYKAGGVHEIHGGRFDTLIVDAGEAGAIEAAQADGWCLSTPEASEAAQATQANKSAAKSSQGAGKALPKQIAVAWPVSS